MRLKDLGYLYSGLTGKSGEDFNVEDSTQGKPFVPFTNIFNNFRVKVDDVRFVSMKKGEVQNRVKTGDILFLMSSEDYESIGKPSVVTDQVDELYLNSFCRGLRVTNKEVYSDYVAYYLSAESVRQVLRLEARGFTRINLKIDRLSSQEVQLPRLSTQRRIVAYLDKQTAAIDSRVAVLEQKLAAYKRLKASVINRVVTRGLDPKAKLKDSGIDWIGKVPEGWALERVKDLIVKRAGGDWGSDDCGNSGDCICLRIADFDYSRGAFKLHAEDEYTTRNYPEDKINKLLLKDGDVLVEKSGGGDTWPVGRAVRFDLNIRAVYANFMDCLRVNDCVILSGYFLSVWRFMYSSRLTWCYLKQTTGIQNLQLTELMGKVCFPVPPVEEQKLIVDYLDAECAKIDKMAELVTREIELYRKLKRSLINEVVTGKRKVA